MLAITTSPSSGTKVLSYRSFDVNFQIVFGRYQQLVEKYCATSERTDDEKLENYILVQGLPLLPYLGYRIFRFPYGMYYLIFK